MSHVLKYQLPGRGRTMIRANVVRWLDVQFQDSELFVWAQALPEGDGSRPMESVLEVVWTGDEVPVSGQGMRTEHIGSAHTIEPGGQPFVVHVFQVWP